MLSTHTNTSLISAIFSLVFACTFTGSSWPSSQRDLIDASSDHRQTHLTTSDDRDKGAGPGGDLSTSFHVTSLQIFFVCSFCSVMPFIPVAPPPLSPTDTSNNTSLPYQHLATKNLESSQICSKASLLFLHLTPYQSPFFLFLLLSFLFYFKFFLLRLSSSTFLVVWNRRKRHFYSSFC